MAVLSNTGIRAGASAAGAGGYQIEKSLRFDGGDDAHLNKTFASGGSVSTWTLSFWIKGHDSAQAVYVFTGGTGTSSYITMDAGQFRFYSNNHDLKTSARYRDPTAWYHFVCVADTTNGTAADRQRIYVNGERITDWATESNVSGSGWALGDFNAAGTHYINRLTSGSQQDMMLAEVHFVDAAAKEPTDFGETDSTTGQWVPIKYAGSYGTTGFYLKFNGTDIGEDSSGNDNDWTATNLETRTGDPLYGYVPPGSGTEPYWIDIKPASSDLSYGTETLQGVLNGSESSGYIYNTGLLATGSGGTCFEQILFDLRDEGTITSLRTHYYCYGTSYDPMHQVLLDADKQEISGSEDDLTGSAAAGGSEWFDFNGYNFSTGTQPRYIKIYYKDGDYTSNGRQQLNIIEVNGTKLNNTKYANTDQNSTPNAEGDESTDTPTDFDDSGNGTGNYCTMNPLYPTDLTLSQGNLKITRPSGSDRAIIGSIAVTSGKWYWEATINLVNYHYLGIAEDNLPPGYYVGQSGSNSVAIEVYANSYIGVYNGNIGTGGSGGYHAGTLSDAPVIGLALDLDSDPKTLKYYIDGTLISGLTKTITTTNPVFPAHGIYTAGVSSEATYNFGARAFAYTPPTGFKALNTYNLPDPTITDPSKYFDTLLYTGNNSASERTITGLNFEPDMIWVKTRSVSTQHMLWDAVRGSDLNLVPSENQTEYGLSGLAQGAITGSASDGIKVSPGSSGADFVNEDSVTYVAWNWDAGSSNTSVSAAGLNSSIYLLRDSWSGGVTLDDGAFENSYPITNAFNGTLRSSGTDFAMSIQNQPLLTMTINPAVTITSSLYVQGETGYDTIIKATIGGTEYTAPSNSGSHTFTETGSLTQITVKGGSASSRTYLEGIKIDGKLLTDTNASYDNVPTLASTYRANPSAGFSIVSYEGNSTTGATIAHGLNAKPDFAIFKNRDDDRNWNVYHKSMGNTHYIELNDSGAQIDDANNWNDTDPDSNVMTLGNQTALNGNSQDIIAYIWSEVSGYSKFGSYTGNADADGPFVWCGFRPRWLLIKNANTTADWQLYDTARETHNEMNTILSPATDAAESSADGYKIDLLSNGFKPLYNYAGHNGDGNTLIFAAFADRPFKYANAR